MAVLPHYSPGYPDWDIVEQPRLLDLIRRTTTHALPFPLDAFDTGMLNPKKSLLAVFGVTRHTDRVERRSALTPCEHCSYLPCQYRRAPYRRTAVRSNPELGGVVADTTVEADRDAGALPLDRQATYSVNTRALQRWAAERLSLDRRRDGAIDAGFGVGSGQELEHPTIDDPGIEAAIQGQVASLGRRQATRGGDELQPLAQRIDQINVHEIRPHRLAQNFPGFHQAFGESGIQPHDRIQRAENDFTLGFPG
jgi:hypothetical protein